MEKHAQINYPDVIRRFFMIFIPLALLTGILTTYNYRSEVKSHRIATEISEVHVLALLEKLALYKFRNIASDLAFLTENHALQSLLDGDSAARSTLGEDWLTVSKRNKTYDQIRFIDLNGQEIVRVDNHDGRPEIVPENLLQNKKKRYFFQNTVILGKDDIFVSPIDLDIEHGWIDRPPKPVILFGTPLFDLQGNKRGIVLLNYLGKDFMDGFGSSSGEFSQGEYHLLNADGFWLSGPESSQEWGFMYGNNETFGKKYPKAWARIQAADHGQFVSDQGMFTFATINPLPKHGYSSSRAPDSGRFSAASAAAGDYHWKTVTLIRAPVLASVYRDMVNKFFGFYLIVALILGVSSFLLALSWTKNKLSKASLIMAHSKLGHLVDKWTAQLFNANQKLKSEVVERRRAEAETQNAYKELNQIFQTAAGGMRVVDRNFNVIRANNTLAKLTGIPLDKIIGSKCYETFPGPNCHNNTCTLSRILDGSPVVNPEVVKRNSVGDEFPCLLTATPFLDDNGKLVGMVEDFMDLTNQKRLESIATAAITMNHLGYVFAGIRHELGNPTNSLKTTVAVLKKKIEEHSENVTCKVIVEFLDRALTDIGRIEYLLHSMRSFNMFEKPIIVDVKTTLFMNNLLSLVENDFKAKGININLDVDSHAVSMKADSQAMQQVMLNLLTNAADALEETDDPRIAIRVFALEKLTGISIKDNGNGMSEDELDNMFTPFYTNKAEGTGLGMLIVKRMISQMNGHIAVESALGEGTNVIITLDGGN